MQDAKPSAPRSNWRKTILIGRRPRATLVRILVLVALCTFTFKFILLPIQVDGISMEPTYHNHHINCIYLLAYWHAEPQRGDVVGIRYSPPGNFSAPSLMLMKRIIGLPGEIVAFHGGRVYINGRLLEEPYLKFPCDWEHAPMQCGPDQYYVVGDNRSMPFGLHTQGRAQREHIVGRVLL